MKVKKLVIIGGGGAGLFCGATLMQLSKEFEVYMISNEDLFCRCSTPYVISRKADFKNTIMPDQMITQFGIKLLKGNVKEIDSKLKIVRYGEDNGTAKIPYDVLMFATGSRAFVPPIEGVDLDGVFSVRTPNDLKKINGHIARSKKAIVVGGGVIGVEMASALRERNLDVSMIILEDKPFSHIADNEFQNMIVNNLTSNKITIINQASLKKISGNKKVKKVFFSRYDEVYSLKADIVIMATGVRANKDLAESIGVKCVKEGIIVDDFMRTNLKDVYAAGDVVLSTDYVTKAKALSQLATNAVIQGKIAGKNIAGFKEKYKGSTCAMGLRFLNDEFISAGINEKSCIEKNIPYYIGVAKTTDIYQDIKGAYPVQVKLIFNAKNNRVIGVQGYGRNLIWVVNLISFAITSNSTIFDLAQFDYASHPSMSPWPFMDPIIMACEDAMMKMQKNNF